MKMKIVYWHDDTMECTFVKKVHGLRAWKVYARHHADSYGDLVLMQKGRTLRCAHVFRHGVVNGVVHSTYREWKA